MNTRQGSGDNRRKLPRLATRIPASGRRISGWLRRGRRLNLSVLDYNRFGAALASDARLAPGCRLLLDMDAGHFLLRKMHAEVVSCIRQGRGYRLGVRFHSPQGVDSSSMLNILSGLEDSLPAQGHL